MRLIFRGSYKGLVFAQSYIRTWGPTLIFTRNYSFLLASCPEDCIAIAFLTQLV